MWRAVAPLLADRHTVVAADLAGYGDSFHPAPTADHAAHGKRAMALDQVEAMAAAGFDRFAVVGHDRGGRVAYRMALDHPARSSAWRCSTSSRPGRCGAAPTRRSRAATGTGRSSLSPRRCPNASSAATPTRSSTSTSVAAWVSGGTRPVPAGGSRRLPADSRRSGRRSRACARTTAREPAWTSSYDEADATAGRQIACPVLVLWAAGGGAPALLRRRARRLAAVGARRPRSARRRLALHGRGSPGGHRPGAAQLPRRRLVAFPRSPRGGAADRTAAYASLVGPQPGASSKRRRAVRTPGQTLAVVLSVVFWVPPLISNSSRSASR